MATEAQDWPHETTERGPKLSACLPHDLIARLGDKWTILVLSLLGGGAWPQAALLADKIWG